MTQHFETDKSMQLSHSLLEKETVSKENSRPLRQGVYFMRKFSVSWHFFKTNVF